MIIMILNALVIATVLTLKTNEASLFVATLATLKISILILLLFGRDYL
jgi:hypothetical protein